MKRSVKVLGTASANPGVWSRLSPCDEDPTALFEPMFVSSGTGLKNPARHNYASKQGQEYARDLIDLARNGEISSRDECTKPGSEF